MQSGVYPIIVIYLSPEERARLIRAMVNWPNVPTRVLTFKEPHEGQIQFVVSDPEPCGNTEAVQVDKKIIEQMEQPSGGETA